MNLRTSLRSCLATLLLSTCVAWADPGPAVRELDEPEAPGEVQEVPTVTPHVATNHQLLKLLARNVIERATAHEWSLQGLGMFRLYLSREVRLHVWVPRLKVPGTATVHTHPWHFTSYVVAGRVTDLRYEVGYREEQRGGSPYYRETIVCGPGGRSTGARELVHLALVATHDVVTGQEYSLRNDIPHETRPEPGTVTLVSREFLPDTEHADVFYPATPGARWVSAEPRPATPDEVAAAKSLALEALG